VRLTLCGAARRAETHAAEERLTARWERLTDKGARTAGQNSERAANSERMASARQRSACPAMRLKTLKGPPRVTDLTPLF